MPRYAVKCRDMPIRPEPLKFEKASQFERNKTTTRHIEAIKSRKNVVKRGVCYYPNKPLKMSAADKRFTSSYRKIMKKK